MLAKHKRRLHKVKYIKRIQSTKNHSTNFPAKMNKEIITDSPKIKWRILDIDKAKEARLEVIDIDKKTAFLKLNLRDIPVGFSVIDYIEFILNNGIVAVDK